MLWILHSTTSQRYLIGMSEAIWIQWLWTLQIRWFFCCAVLIVAILHTVATQGIVSILNHFPVLVDEECLKYTNQQPIHFFSCSDAQFVFSFLLFLLNTGGSNAAAGEGTCCICLCAQNKCIVVYHSISRDFISSTAKYFIMQLYEWQIQSKMCWNKILRSAGL